jgi:RNA-directed DNA polymerase
MGTVETQERTYTQLERIAWLSKQKPDQKFGSLMHHFDLVALLHCFEQLDEKKAVGIDGVTKEDYARNLLGNLQELIVNLKKMAYRPKPVREVLIPKEGKPGATRPLGISILEDKIVQKRFQQILESIYEPLFLDCSFGFRPGKGCHDAIEALQHHLFNNVTQTVIDIDLKNFFGTIDHKLLEEILKEKIIDTRFMRYISRMFKAGVLSNGDLKISDEGVPQGSICSPILANIFAHYAIDTWIEEMVKPHCKGKIAAFRYADDMVICCQYDTDAQRIRRTLVKRLEKFKLQLNEEKTKLVPFDKIQASKGIKQGTFDFLGFTFYCGVSLGKRIIPKLKTKGKTFRAKLKKVNEWCKQIRNQIPLKEIWRTFKAKLRGHVQYYGVSHNAIWVKKFLDEARKIMFKWLNRRSQMKSFTWEQFDKFVERNPLPAARIVHRLF